MKDNIPSQPVNSIRITLVLNEAENRLDSVLLQAIRDHDNKKLKEISRVKFKKLFADGKILIKSQRARASSGLAKGTTYVDILGI
jgi:hypothetical protein